MLWLVAFYCFFITMGITKGRKEKTMRKTTVLLGALLFISLIYPLLVVLTALFGFEVVVKDWLWYGILSTLIFAGLSIWLFIIKDKATSLLGRIFAALLLPTALVNVLFWALFGDWLIWGLSLIWVGFSVAMLLVYPRSWITKLTVGVVAGFMAVITLMACFIAAFPMGQNTVVQSAESPNGAYRAELIDSDQGALGGDTLVEVHYLHDEVDAFIFLFRRTPNRVYRGDWGEFENIKISWKSDNELKINNKVYLIE